MCRVAAGREKDRAKSGCGLLELEQGQSERFPVVSYFTLDRVQACVHNRFVFLPGTGVQRERERTQGPTATLTALVEFN